MVLLLVSGSLLALSAWLLTYDVYSDIGPQYGGDPRPQAGPSFCGSAYDIAWLEGDGFMGGEVTVNHWAIDRDCVRKAGRLVTAGSSAGTLGVVTGAGAGFLLIRGSRRQQVLNDGNRAGEGATR